jgi:hypothetical protein
MKAIRYEKDTVLIQEGKIKSWVDVVVRDDGSLYIDWNKMIYYLYKREDTILREWQDKAENFDNATDLAVDTLLNLGIIYIDDNGKWHQTEKFHTTKGSIPMK